MKFKNFVQNFVTVVKTNIIELVHTELSNENKKLVLDQKIIDFLDKTFEKLSLNFVLKYALKRLLLPNISLFTQVIYDLLRANIAGVTK